MDYSRLLTDLASRFTVTTGTATSPLERVILLQPPADLLDVEGLALSITELQNVLVELPINVDLAFLGKWVRTLTPDFPADPAAENPIGGMPIVEQILGTTGLTTNLPPATLMTGEQTKPGVPEVLGRIKGTITPTVEKLREVLKRQPVAVWIEWKITDDSTGQPPADIWMTESPGPAPAPDDTSGFLSRGFLFVWPRSLRVRLPAYFSELTSDAPEVLRVTLSVRIRLRVDLPTGAIETTWISLPPLKLPIPTVPVPTILVLCEHKDFGGRKLVLVPDNSLIGAAAGVVGATTINTALGRTTSALQTLTTAVEFVNFVAGLVPGASVASSVLTSLAASPSTIIARHSQVPDLTAPEYVFHDGWWPFSADNMPSSMICVGRPGTVFRLHHHSNFDTSITPLEITLDHRMGCAIRLLNELDPNTVYGGLFRDEGPRIVYGGNITVVRPFGNHEDVFSSVTLTGPSAKFIKV